MTAVVVSVGTDHHQFDRLLDWVERAQDELGVEFKVQCGATPPRSGLDAFDYLPVDELEAMMRSADAVVCHGGPGTISLALKAGHRPIVVPRNPRFGEHVDDHQMRYTARLASRGVIDIAVDVDQFLSMVTRPRPTPDVAGRAATSASAVKLFGEIVDRLLLGEVPRRRWRDRFLVKRTP